MAKNYILILTIIVMMYSVYAKTVTPIEEVEKFIESQLISEIKPRKIHVYTGIDWEYLMLESVSKFLFEDINIIENLAPKGQVNRPGDIYDKHYICVHDTGDHNHGAKEWSDAVKNAHLGQSDYNFSYQYVVGNDGYYHNIPDNEIAYHAGDGHTNASIFGLNSTGIFTNKYTSEKPKIEIDEEGFFVINGQKSQLLAPTNNGIILKTKDINDLGIYSELQKVEGEENNYEYFLGRTWFSPTYKYISNYGGNLNSIGIESCINHDTDVYYTWQKVAKLVAKLMDENNLGIDSVVQHHYFSGKNCPQTMRTAKLWDFYKTMISAEYQMLQYQKEGYTFKFISESEYLNEKGRVIKTPEEDSIINYRISIMDSNNNTYTYNYFSKIIIQNGNNNQYLKISFMNILLLILLSLIS